MFDIQGKVALITGGAKGIGFSIAKELLRNGAKGVALLDIDFESGKTALEELKKEFSEDCAIYLNTDVTQRSQFEDAFEKTIQNYKQLDIVINSAGIVHEKQWERCIAVNLQGVITGSLLALDKYLPDTLGPSGGVIVNVSSVSGIILTEFNPVYTATKHAVVAFSRSISGPNRSRGLNVRVITICPGLTRTAMQNRGGSQLDEEFIPLAIKAIESWPFQNPEQLAQHAVSVMNNGKTGSVWAINDNKSTEIEFPTLFNVV